MIIPRRNTTLAATPRPRSIAILTGPGRRGRGGKALAPVSVPEYKFMDGRRSVSTLGAPRILRKHEEQRRANAKAEGARRIAM
jgi:hypothetical protein